MKNYILVYGILVIAFIIYNIFFIVKDERIDTIINILIVSIVVLYTGFMAFVLLRKMKKNPNKH